MWEPMVTRREMLRYDVDPVFDIGSREQFDVYQSLGVAWDLEELVFGTMTAAQFQETYRQEFQAAFDAYFIRKLRRIYPKATIVLATTILNHNENWDKSIDAVCRELKDPKIHHFLYSNNGCGTHGHIRKPEAEQMGRELCGFIESLGSDVWED